MHIERDTWLELLNGRVPPHLAERLLGHLAATCPDCRRECRAALKAGSRREGSAHPGLLLPSLKTLHERIEREREEARRDLRALLGLDPRVAQVRVQRARKRFRSPILAELLLTESDRHVRRNPQAASDLARLATEVAYRSRVGALGEEIPFEILARAHAYLANALRRSGDLVAADRLIAGALDRLRDISDPQARAEIEARAGALRRDQGRFSEALAHLDRACRLLRSAGENRSADEAAVSLGLCLQEAGRPQRAWRVLSEVLERLDPADTPDLYLAAAHNLALVYLDLGEPQRARRQVEALAPVYARVGGRWAVERREWTCARIAAALGEPAEAEGRFLSIRKALLEGGEMMGAAQVSLDLALLYAEAGRFSEVAELATSAAAECRRVAPRGELLTALVLLREAAERKALTGELVRRLVRRVRRRGPLPDARLGR